MTMDEIARLLDRLVERVKVLETEVNLQEQRIWELEHDYNYLDSRLENIEDETE